MRRADILAAIDAERSRQFNLPGSEFDAKNSPNDWIAIATHYLGENNRRGSGRPEEEEFALSLTKAAAVIVAALENIATMREHGEFTKARQLGANDI